MCLLNRIGAYVASGDSLVLAEILKRRVKYALCDRITTVAVYVFIRRGENNVDNNRNIRGKQNALRAVDEEIKEGRQCQNQ